MRIPYVPDPPPTSTDEDKAIVERIRRRRDGGLGAIDRTLLHAPATADGWYVGSNEPPLILHLPSVPTLPIVV